LKTSTADATGSTFKKLYFSDPAAGEHDYIYARVVTSSGTTAASLQFVQHSVANNTDTVFWVGNSY
jgi:hypothetical protein